MKTKLFLLILLIFPVGNAHADNNNQITILIGENNPVCRAALPIMTEIAEEMGFESSGWMEKFPSITLAPLPEHPRLSFAIHDIDNDGQMELIIKDGSLFQSVAYDKLYILKSNYLSKIRQALNPYPALGANSMQFSFQQQDAVPVNIHVWVYGGQSLLLMKDFFFDPNVEDLPERHVGQVERDSWNSFYIAQLRNNYTRHDKVYGITYLIPQIVCQFKFNSH